MTPLFVFRRRGLVVVHGIVKALNRETVSIEGDVFLPVSERVEKKVAVLTFSERLLRNMRPQIGSEVVATASNDFAVDMLMDGAETPQKEFHLKGYNIRYSGSFDFGAYENEKEQHVFVGRVLSIKSGGTIRPWNCVTLGWKRNGQNELRTVMFWQKDFPVKPGKRCIMVTGERKVSKGREFYNAVKVFR